MVEHDDHTDTTVDLIGDSDLTQTEKAIVAKVWELGKKKSGRILGITGSNRQGKAIGARQELRSLSKNVKEPIVTTRSPKLIDALITIRTGLTKREREKNNIIVDINAS